MAGGARFAVEKNGYVGIAPADFFHKLTQRDHRGRIGVRIAGEFFVINTQNEGRGAALLLGKAGQVTVAGDTQHFDAFGLDGFGQGAYAQSAGVFRTKIFVDDDDGETKAHGKRPLRGEGKRGIICLPVKGRAFDPLFEGLPGEAIPNNHRMTPQDPASAPHHGTASPTAARLRGLRLLVVDDNPSNRHITCELLADEGALISMATNGAQAVDAVCSADLPFDAVLMDLQMPVMDGYTATQCIRQHPHLRRLPIIALTAHAMSADREACFAAGMNEHVGRPIDLDPLVDLIERLTGTHAHTLLTARSHGPSAADAASATAPAWLRPGVAPPDVAIPDVAIPDVAIPEAALRYADEHAIELAAAVQRLGGKQPLYVRSLVHFLQSTAELPACVQALLRQRDFAAIEQQWQGLGGLAATLGFTALSRTAAQAEQAARQGRGTDSHHQDHRAVASHVALTLASAHVHAEHLAHVLRATLRSQEIP